MRRVAVARWSVYERMLDREEREGARGGIDWRTWAVGCWGALRGKRAGNS